MTSVDSGRELAKQKRHSPPLRPMLVMPVGLAICEMWFQHYNSLFNSIGFTPAAHTVNNNMTDNLITVFNTVKSRCLIVTSKWAPMNPPAFYLNSTLLPITDSYKYLIHIINSCLTDDLDIQKQTISLYA